MIVFLIVFRCLRGGSVAPAMLDIVKRRRRPPVAAKSDPSVGLADPSDVVARPL